MDEDRRPKNTGTRMKLIPSGDADLSGFFFVLLTTSSPALLLKGEGCLLRSESC